MIKYPHQLNSGLNSPRVKQSKMYKLFSKKENKNLARRNKKALVASIIL